MSVQLSRPQFLFLCIWLVLGTGILLLPASVGKFALRDGWISAGLASIGGFVVIGVIGLFTRVFPGESLLQGYLAAFGPWLGRLAGLWQLLLVFIVEALVARELEEFIATTILPNTPSTWIAGMILFPACYATYLGLEVVGRMGEIISPIGIIITLGLFLLATPYLDFSYIHPVLADGWDAILRGDVVLWALLAEFTFTLQIRHSTDANWYLRTLGTAVLILAGSGVIAELTVHLVLGLSTQYTFYPILEVVRAIRIGDFLERLDTLYVIGVVATIFLKLSFLHYVLTSGLQEWATLQHQRPLVWSGGIVVWAACLFLWHGREDKLFLIQEVMWGYITVGGVGLVGLAAVVQLIRRWWTTRKSVGNSL
ncbi:GerAB/ArcD/ProY family transporter [Kyrpidia tusciae]|uniref:Spore germination protein n=1 Tax=Kyrpidia tusciae (strain DSM 2912 / NBRC 15312 / T2) TaxID=562970 RepID=D5WY20_KYRT2|nr:endospore germination permease [Kyrpidia tusciae]ADG06079.1 spore germination protein [Kyrpidia tusciae DSM 2912]